MIRMTDYFSGRGRVSNHNLAKLKKKFFAIAENDRFLAKIDRLPLEIDIVNSSTNLETQKRESDLRNISSRLRLIKKKIIEIFYDNI